MQRVCTRGGGKEAGASLQREQRTGKDEKKRDARREGGGEERTAENDRQSATSLWVVRETHGAKERIKYRKGKGKKSEGEG